jgi:hypothetical protein
LKVRIPYGALTAAPEARFEASFSFDAEPEMMTLV